METSQVVLRESEPRSPDGVVRVSLLSDGWRAQVSCYRLDLIPMPAQHLLRVSATRPGDYMLVTRVAHPQDPSPDC